MRGLEDPDGMILHLVHPAKIAVDAGATAASLWLLWKGRTGWGLVVHYVLPLAASAAILRGDLDGLRQTRRGRYALSIPQVGHVLRAAGDTLLVSGARRQRRAVVVAGAAVQAAGWASGLVAPVPQRETPLADPPDSRHPAAGPGQP